MDLYSFQGIAKQASGELKLLQFDYTKADGTIESYITEPYEIREDNGNMVYFGFKLAEDGGIRKFIVERIGHVTIVNQTYTPRWPIKIW